MTVCALGGEQIDGPVFDSPIYGGPTCLTHLMAAMSRDALTPASRLDKDHFDRVQDARAESLDDDPVFAVLPEDLPDVPGGSMAGSPSGPTLGGRAASPPRPSAEEAIRDDSSPRRANARAA